MGRWLIYEEADSAFLKYFPLWGLIVSGFLVAMNTMFIVTDFGRWTWISVIGAVIPVGTIVYLLVTEYRRKPPSWVLKRRQFGDSVRIEDGGITIGHQCYLAILPANVDDTDIITESDMQRVSTAPPTVRNMVAKSVAVPVADPQHAGDPLIYVKPVETQYVECPCGKQIPPRQIETPPATQTLACSRCRTSLLFTSGYCVKVRK